jgi:hypothetical protein
MIIVFLRAPNLPVCSRTFLFEAVPRSRTIEKIAAGLHLGRSGYYSTFRLPTSWTHKTAQEAEASLCGKRAK